MFKLEFSTDNAAFDDAPATEIARILRDIAGKVERGDYLDGASIHDFNGNRVGEWWTDSDA